MGQLGELHHIKLSPGVKPFCADNLKASKYLYFWEWRGQKNYTCMTNGEYGSDLASWCPNSMVSRNGHSSNKIWFSEKLLTSIHSIRVYSKKCTPPQCSWSLDPADKEVQSCLANLMPTEDSGRYLFHQFCACWLLSFHHLVDSALLNHRLALLVQPNIFRNAWVKSLQA